MPETTRAEELATALNAPPLATQGTVIPTGDARMNRLPPPQAKGSIIPPLGYHSYPKRPR